MLSSLSVIFYVKAGRKKNEISCIRENPFKAIDLVFYYKVGTISHSFFLVPVYGKNPVSSMICKGGGAWLSSSSLGRAPYSDGLWYVTYSAAIGWPPAHHQQYFQRPAL